MQIYNSAKNGARVIQFSSSEGVREAKHDGVSFKEIISILPTQRRANFFSSMIPFDRVYHKIQSNLNITTMLGAQKNGRYVQVVVEYRVVHEANFSHKKNNIIPDII